MKKLYNIIMVLAMVMTACLWQSCSDSYPDMSYVSDNRNSEEYETDILVPSLNVNSLLYATSKVANKGSVGSDSEGPLDPENDYENFIKRYARARFYILAYRKTVMADGSGTLSTLPDFTRLMGDDDNRLNCLLSTERPSISGSDQHVGKLAVPQGAKKDGNISEVKTNGSLDLLENADWEDNQNYKLQRYFWNTKKYEKVGYNFFAYYIGNADVYGFERYSDCVKIDLKLDGKNDIMVGSAPEVTEDLLKKEYAKSVTEDEIRKNIVKYGDGAYSTYGAVHSVQPKIDLKHALAYIKFRVKKIDEETDVSLIGIRVKDVNSRGKLTVASRDLENIKLGLTDFSEPKDIDVPAYVPSSEISTEDYTQAGEGVLVPPSSAYQIEVGVQQENKKTSETDEEASGSSVVWLPPITCAPENGFEAGKIYVIDISVYGTTAIIITTEVEGWKSDTGATVDLYDE